MPVNWNSNRREQSITFLHVTVRIVQLNGFWDKVIWVSVNEPRSFLNQIQIFIPYKWLGIVLNKTKMLGVADLFKHSMQNSQIIQY